MTARRAVWSLATLAIALALLAAVACWALTALASESGSYDSGDPEYIRIVELIRWSTVLWPVTPWLVLATIVTTVLAVSLAAVQRPSMHRLATRERGDDEAGHNPRPRSPVST